MQCQGEGAACFVTLMQTCTSLIYVDPTGFRLPCMQQSLLFRYTEVQA